MMVDDIGVRYLARVLGMLILKIFQDVTVTNDGASILSLLDVEHPAGKILVDLAQQQDKEVSRLRHYARIFTDLRRLAMGQPQ